MPQTLLELTKNYLNITWSGDVETDMKVSGIIARSLSYLSKRAGEEINLIHVNEEGEEVIEESDTTQLFLDCCRYIYNDCFEDFKHNFSEELFMLRAEKQTDGIVLTEEV